MAYRDVLAMPIRGFWMLSAQVTRLRAEEALEQIDLFWIANANVGPENVAELRKALLERMGEPAKAAQGPRYVSPEEHEKGIETLRNMFG